MVMAADACVLYKETCMLLHESLAKLKAAGEPNIEVGYSSRVLTVLVSLFVRSIFGCSSGYFNQSHLVFTTCPAADRRLHVLL